MENNNLPIEYKKSEPLTLRSHLKKYGKIIGSTVAFGASMTALFVGTAVFVPLVIPTGILAMYTTQKFLNNTLYKSYKDLDFIARKSGGKIKIYQDVVRPDIFIEMSKLDIREKIGFLQLQTLIGMTKFDRLDKKGNSVTIETNSHGIIRKTFKRLAELGYLENYQESLKGKSHLILEKITTGNMDIRKQTEMYTMQFQKTDKQIDFEDENFRRLFPAVFGVRGIIAKRRIYNRKG